MIERNRLVGRNTGWPTEIEIMRSLTNQLTAWKRIAVLASIISFLLGIIVVLVITLVSRPNCPTEDSCYVDYRNGVWHVMEGNREDIPMP